MDSKKSTQTILMIGAGPTVIGQTGFFEHAGLNACRALGEEGHRVVVLNSDPASLVAESGLADKVYVEPLTPEVLEKIIVLEKPDGLMLTFGGQAGLNLGYHLISKGVLQKHPIRMLGVDEKLLAATEERGRFAELMAEAGLTAPSGVLVRELHEGLAAGRKFGFPLVVRTPFSSEGSGVNIAFNLEEMADYLDKALSVSPSHTAWLEECLLNWREFEVEAVRDVSGHCLIVAVLEKVDPAGVHPGDSVIVTPSQSLTAEQVQLLAEVSGKALDRLGVTGGANLQWVINPENGEIRILRVNLRFTRSAALVSRSTGFPIAAVSAKLMAGADLMTAANIKDVPADRMFRPENAAVAVRMPRFDFAKFSDADRHLTSTMKSTGEAWGVGGSFKEAFQKAIRALDAGYCGYGADRPDPEEAQLPLVDLKAGIANPGPNRLFNLRLGLKRGMTPADLAKLSRINLWFVNQLAELAGFEKKISTYALYNLDPKVLLQAKLWGYSDNQLAYLLRSSESELRKIRIQTGIVPGFHSIKDKVSENEICRYSGYGMPDETPEPDEPAGMAGQKRAVIIGSGPVRIGQGTEYDYCAALAARSLRRAGYAPLYVNSVPGSGVPDFARETVYYAEPLTPEDLLNILGKEKPQKIVTHFSGAAESTLVNALRESGITVESSVFESNHPIFRERLKTILAELGVIMPGYGEAGTLEDARQIASKVGYPVLLQTRSGLERLMSVVVYQPDSLADGWDRTVKDNNPPIFIEHIPDNAIGIQLSGVGDGKKLIASTVIEQIEEAIVDIGDSACALPAYTIGRETADKLKTAAARLVGEFNIRGLFNIRFSVKHNTVFWGGMKSGVSQMLPFVMKATGGDWVEAAIQVLLERPVEGIPEEMLNHTAIREAVFNFENFPGVDTVLGPEQRSTGSVVALDRDFGLAFIKSQLAAGENLPPAGNIYLNIRDEDKRAFIAIAKQLIELGFSIFTTDELAGVFTRSQIPCREVSRVGEGRPDILDRIKNGEVQWVINTPADRKAKRDETLIRSTAVARRIPITTTLSGAQAAVSGLERYHRFGIQPRELKDYFSEE